MTGTEAEIDAFVALVRSFGIKEMVRTGAVVMARGSGSIEELIKHPIAGGSTPVEADKS